MNIRAIMPWFASATALVLAGTLTTPAVAAPTAEITSSVSEPAASDVGGPFDPAPARAAIERLVGERNDIRLVAVAPEAGADHYQVTGSDGLVQIEATSPASMVKGFHAYLGAELDMSISWNVDNVGATADSPLPALPDQLPLPSEAISASANVDHRFVGNDTEDGYTGPYRSWDDWERAIDVFAAHGLDEVFVPVGTEAVYLETLTKFGYTEQEILEWIPQPGHQPWWLLQNMSNYPSPVSAELVAERAELGRKITDRLRELGMTPVLPGYFGTVPADFSARNQGAEIVPQGNWVGFARPDWLSPAGPVFADVAEEFYASSERILGTSTMYKMDLLHEGGKAGDVNVGDATRAVEDALQAARPGALWVLLGWQNNPPKAVITAADPETTFIVDGLSDRHQLDREASWSGTPYAFGSIWNFGGHTTMGAQLSLWNTRYFEWLEAGDSAMNGVAIMPEAGDNNPVALDFLASRAWAEGPVDLETWFDDWAERRYGVADESASAAWDVLRSTAYDLPTNDGWSEAQDGLYGAVPSLTASKAATWSPGTERYDMEAFAEALPLLLEAGPAVRATPTYAYDLMDVSRQVLSNTSRTLLPQLAAASADQDAAKFRQLSDEWLANMDLLDDVVGTQEQNLLGRWIDQARSSAATAEEAEELQVDALKLVTTWGDRSAVNAGLNDYGNREWQGLVGVYYKDRWEQYLDAQHQALEAGTAPAAIDWYAVGENFVRADHDFATAASGDVVALAREVVDRHEAAEPSLPEPPGNGKTYISDLPFADSQSNPAYGPIERDTEIGQAPAGDGGPLRIAGTEYAKGLGVNSPTTIDVNLGGKCSVFEAVAGIDDSMDKADAYPSVIFKVHGDGNVLYESDIVRAADPQNLSVDVSGVEILRLEVDPAASVTQTGHEAEWWDRADWADAAVTCADQETPELPVEVDVKPRCIAGNAFIAVIARNQSSVPVAMQLTTDFGQKSVDVAPGKSGYQAFATRSSEIGAGTVKVSAVGNLEGVDLQQEMEASYEAVKCS